MCVFCIILDGIKGHGHMTFQCPESVSYFKFVDEQSKFWQFAMAQIHGNSLFELCTIQNSLVRINDAHSFWIWIDQTILVFTNLGFEGDF